jgi:hypothetical protein
MISGKCFSPNMTGLAVLPLRVFVVFESLSPALRCDADMVSRRCFAPDVTLCTPDI